MRKWKKAISFALATAMSLSILAGCKVETNDEALKKGDDESQFYEIKMITGYPVGQVPKDFDLVMEKVNEVLKEKINAKLTLTLVDWMGLDSNLNLKINAAEKFDICYTGVLANDYFNNVRREVFTDLTDLLPKYAPTIWKTVEPSYWDSIRSDGKIYAVINRQIVGRQFCAAFRKTTFDAYSKTSGAKKLDEITTVEDISDYLAFAKTQSKDDFINATFDIDGLMTYWGFDVLGGSWKIPGVVKYDDGELKVVNQFDTDEWRSAMKLSADWYNKGYFWPDMSINSPKFNLLQMRFPPTYKPGIETEEKQFTTYDAEFAKLGETILFTRNLQMTMNAISRTSDNPIRALKLLELLYSDKDLFNLLVFGIEGKHYHVVGETASGLKRVELIDNSGYSMPIAWAFGDQFNQWLTPGQPDDVWEQTKAVNDSATVSKSFGFNFDSSNLKTEYANCSNIVDEYWYNVLIGFGKSQEKIDEMYDKFLKNLKSAGADTIIKEMQRQIDEWKASKQ